ncbi:hypothetical protein Ait01nite_025270 [Actinoplanes italicus]|nr:hypothetical protein Ait01nite_025270 [Actinoplanes italicus]
MVTATPTISDSRRTIRHQGTRESRRMHGRRTGRGAQEQHVRVGDGIPHLMGQGPGTAEYAVTSGGCRAAVPPW